MIRKVHILVLKTFLGPFVAAFFIALFVLLMQFLWNRINILIGKGVDWLTVLEFLVYSAISLMPTALPLAMLVASIMTFGEMGEFYELTALKSSGISLPRIFFPLFIFTFLLSIGAFLFTNYVVSESNYRLSLLVHDLRRTRPEMSLTPGAFNNDIDGYSIKISENKKGVLRNVMLYEHLDTTGKGANNVTIADSATMFLTADKKNILFTLYNGNRYEEGIRRNAAQGGDSYDENSAYFPLTRNGFKQQQVFIEAPSQFTSDNMFMIGYRERNMQGLEIGNDSVKAVVDYYRYNYLWIMYRKMIFTREVKNENITNVSVNPNKIPQNLDSAFAAMTAKKQSSLMALAYRMAGNTQNFITNRMAKIVDNKKTIKRYDIEWHRKMVLPFACIIFFFVGAPFGAIIRKGGMGWPLVFSVAIFIVYYILSISGEKLAKEGSWTTAGGMWFPSFVILVVGLWLSYKASRDSVWLSLDTYKGFFKRASK